MSSPFHSARGTRSVCPLAFAIANRPSPAEIPAMARNTKGGYSARDSFITGQLRPQSKASMASRKIAKGGIFAVFCDKGWFTGEEPLTL